MGSFRLGWFRLVVEGALGALVRFTLCFVGFRLCLDDLDVTAISLGHASPH